MHKIFSSIVYAQSHITVTSVSIEVHLRSDDAFPPPPPKWTENSNNIIIAPSNFWMNLALLTSYNVMFNLCTMHAIYPWCAIAWNKDTSCMFIEF